MDIFAELISSAHDGASGINGLPHPTAEQARSGNYKKGRITLHGMPIAIETPAGQRRTGKSDGQPWSVICMAHYGEFSGTKGADGDPVDVFIGPWPESERAYIINRVNPNGDFDEHKCLIGFTDATSAINAYKNSYERGQSGLGSFIPCSIEQLKWWLKFGDHSVPATAKSLPHDGSVNMNEKAWDNNAMPVGTDMPAIMYELRKGDMADGLLLDSACAKDILGDSDGELLLDALVIPFNRLERKMNQMQLAMNSVSETVKPLATQITAPFKQRGTTNVASVTELSDGQTISVFFHNPDSTPNKLSPDDEMVSWKWLLNKKDVTILVAPEQGKDLNPREVARRIMRLAERNSARFQAANTKRSERMASIEAMQNSISERQGVLQSLDAEITALEQKLSEKEASNVVPDVSAADIVEPALVPAAAALQGEVINEHGEAVAGINTEVDIGNTVIQPQEDVGREPFKAGETVYIKPEWQDRGDELFTRIALDDEDQGRVMVKTIGGIKTTAVIDSYMIERRTPEEQAIVVRTKGILSPEGYAIASKGSNELLVFHQDTLDAFFQSRIVDVRNAMRDLDWFGTEMMFTKSGSPLRFTYDVASVGAGANVVGVKYQLVDENGVEVVGLVDDLTKSPDEIAESLDSSAPVSGSENINNEPLSLEVRMEMAAQGYDIATGFDEIQPIVDEAKDLGREELAKILFVLYQMNRPIYSKYQNYILGDKSALVSTPEELADAIIGMPAIDPDADLVASAVDAAKSGAGGITKLANGQYFTFDVDGDEIILSDELRAKVEGALGEKLVEHAYADYPNEISLVPASLVPSADAAQEITPENAALTADKEFLQSVIDGNVDMLDQSLADNLSAIYDKYLENPEFMDLIAQAAQSYSDFMVNEASKT